MQSYHSRILMVTMDASVHLRNNLASQTIKDSTTKQSDEDVETGNISGVVDVIPGGLHQEGIKSADIAFNRPIVATMSSDRTIR